MTATPQNTVESAAWVEAGGRRFRLDADAIHVVGSGDHASVRLVHSSIAPSHAMLSFHRGRFVVESVGESPLALCDGTVVRGELALEAGARLRLGSIELTLGVGEPAEAVTAPVARREPGFGDLMAHELRRAPWFLLSAALHAIAFLALWLLVPPPKDRIATVVRFSIDEADGTSDLPMPPDAEQPQIEVQEPPTPLVEPPVIASDEPVDEPTPFDDSASSLLALGDMDAMFERVTGESGAGDIFGKGGAQKFSAGFRKTVAGLRMSGLEIVFAFDSTGSMGPVLKATKERMTRMVRALHALVPDARIGVVTYRDRGERERYVTRAVPLDRDLYRSLAFLQTVDADGGGDRPEAILEALEVAMTQSWNRRARRVVVVIGDAPAHRETEGELERRVRRFCQDGNGYVHAIITSSDLGGQPERDVLRSFQRLARAGRGTCVNAERDETILKQVLSLAVGAEFRDNVDKVFELVAEQEGKIATRALDLVHRADLAELRRELSRSVVDDDIVEALARSNRRQIGNLLVVLLRDKELPATGLHAAGWALQRLLALGEPLVDPEKPVVLSDERAERLLEMCKALR